jgi:hypothetical protein
MLQEYSTFRKIHKNLPNLDYLGEYFSRIDDFLVKMVQHRIELEDLESLEFEGESLAQTNNWMLTLNVILCNDRIKSLTKFRVDACKNKILQLSASSDHQTILKDVLDFLSENLSKSNWQVKQRSKVTVFDERFWSLDDLLEIHPVYGCIQLVEFFESHSTV